GQPGAERTHDLLAGHEALRGERHDAAYDGGRPVDLEHRLGGLLGLLGGARSLVVRRRLVPDGRTLVLALVGATNAVLAEDVGELHGGEGLVVRVDHPVGPEGDDPARHAAAVDRLGATGTTRRLERGA